MLHFLVDLMGLGHSYLKPLGFGFSSLSSHLLALPSPCSVIEQAGPVLPGIHSYLANDEVVE